MTTTPLTAEQLADLRDPLVARLAESTGFRVDQLYAVADLLLPDLAELGRLREQVAELETYAQGCDGEGCVLPHSSWCQRSKAYAAEHDGCTCGRPWEGTPQAHSGHCWLVHPPRSEVDEMRAGFGRVRAELATAQAQIAAVIALPSIGHEALELMDPEQYHQAIGYNDGLAASTHAINDAAARPGA